MLRDYSKARLLWSKHAASEAIEDNFDPREIEAHLRRVVELPEFSEDKRRGIIRVGGRHCTLIYAKKKHGLIVITCWESNPTDVKEYNRVIKGGGLR